MKKLFHLILAALFALATQAAEITYRVASYDADFGNFVLEAWGEKPAGAYAFFFNDYGATTGNRYNQIPRNREASFELYGWQGCTIKSITFSMCSNNKAGTIGYSIVDGDTEISKMAAVDFASDQWFGEWLSKDQYVYGDVTKLFNLSPLATDTLCIYLKGGTSEGSVYVNSITIDYDAPQGATLESPMGWAFEKLEKKSVLAEGDVIMLYRSGVAAGDLGSMEQRKFLDAVGINSTADVNDPDVALFTLAKDGTAWTLTDQHQRKLGARKANNLAWDEGVTTWNIELGYDGATIASTNENYGTMRFNAPSGSYARFWNYYTKTLALPYIYRRTGQNQPVPCTAITLGCEQRTVALGAQDTIMLKPAIAPAKATDRRVRWESSDTSVATVKSGVVHPVGVGTVIIKATTVSGGLEAQMQLTVTSAAATGDINGDGAITVADATALVNKMLGTADLPDALCDINADGKVDVGDVTALIALILKGE